MKYVAGVAKWLRQRVVDPPSRGFESLPRYQTGIDYSHEAVADAEEWLERDRQWRTICKIFRLDGSRAP
jgi:hypothetical protein